MDLMIVADDLTGAFDSSVPFVGMGVDVVTSLGSFRSANAQARVLSVNTASRHLPPLGSFIAVSGVIEDACKAGVPIIVKKTDSVLRGNVGAELAALWEGVDRATVHFIPAWPSMGRTTSGGIHYVHGVPVAESPFGNDPFDAVSTSQVCKLLAQQTDAPVLSVGEDEPAPMGFSGIAVYDATTEDAVAHRVHELVLNGNGRLALAGCGGLAHSLASELGADALPAPVPTGVSNGLLVFCGSVNQVSVDQCRFASQSGAPTHSMGIAEKSDPAWLGSAEGEAFCDAVVRSWSSCPLTVVDATSFDLSDAHAVNGERDLIATNLGRTLARICRKHPRGRVLAIGGDVMLALLEQLGIGRVHLLGEAAQGVVASEIALDGATLTIMAKSGGFGGRDLFVQLSEASQG